MPRFEPHPKRRPAIVAGASSGIGAATARALAQAGFPVALGARRAQRCAELAAEITSAGGEAIGLALDVADDESVRNFTTAVTRDLGPVEVLVSCAGGLDAELIHQTGSAAFVSQLQVHLAGVHRLVSAVVPEMVQRKRGDVVLVSSDVARSPRPRMGAYVAAKYGVEGMARAMQMELEGTGVRASVVRPGPTSTEMGMSWDPQTVQAVLDDWAKWGLARHPYFLRPSDVAAAVLAVVCTPRGAHLTLVEVEPEAPLTEPGLPAEGS